MDGGAAKSCGVRTAPRELVCSGGQWPLSAWEPFGLGVSVAALPPVPGIPRRPGFCSAESRPRLGLGGLWGGTLAGPFPQV